MTTEQQTLATLREDFKALLRRAEKYGMKARDFALSVKEGTDAILPIAHQPSWIWRWYAPRPEADASPELRRARVSMAVAHGLLEDAEPPETYSPTRHGLIFAG